MRRQEATLLTTREIIGDKRDGVTNSDATLAIGLE